jgi:hypothetical protein
MGNSSEAGCHQLAARRKRIWRRAVVGIPMLGGLVSLLGFFFPFLVLGSSMRDGALEGALAQSGWTVVSASATGGWFQPVSFFDVRISDGEGRFSGRISEIRTNSRLVDLFSGGPERRSITLIKPEVEILISEGGEWPRCSSGASDRTLDFSVEGGALKISAPRRNIPIVDVGGCDFSGSVGPDENGARWLVVSPLQVFDHEPLSDSQCQQNLALIAPILSQSTELSGAVSVWLDEIRIPLDGLQSSPFPIKGRAEIHSLEAKLKNGWARQISAVTGAASGVQVPDRISVIENTSIDFEANDKGVYHKGTAFLLPEISPEFKVVSAGTVCLDETIDLTLSVFLPADLGKDSETLAFLRGLSVSPIPLAVKGTVSAPTFGLPEGIDIFGEISRRVSPAKYTEEPPEVPSAISDLIQGVVQPESDGVKNKRKFAGSILNLIRAVEKQRK